MIPHILNANGTISLMLNGEMKPIDNSHPNYEEIKQALKEQRWEDIPGLVDIEKIVKDATEGFDNISIRDGEILYQGYAIHNTLTQRILTMIDEGFDVTHMLKFLDNLMQNPSNRAVMELYDFLEAGNIPITENGTFLTYKKIRNDWKDIYSGTFDNSIGSVVEMPRNQVDENSEITCSVGLHVCSYDYLPHFGSAEENRVVICEVNPADVVAIPKDYNNTKMRVCRYKVIGEVENYQDDNILSKKSVFETNEFSNDNEEQENINSTLDELIDLIVEKTGFDKSIVKTFVDDLKEKAAVNDIDVDAIITNIIEDPMSALSEFFGKKSGLENFVSTMFGNAKKATSRSKEQIQEAMESVLSSNDVVKDILKTFGGVFTNPDMDDENFDEFEEKGQYTKNFGMELERVFKGDMSDLKASIIMNLVIEFFVDYTDIDTGTIDVEKLKDSIKNKPKRAAKFISRLLFNSNGWKQSDADVLLNKIKLVMN